LKSQPTTTLSLIWAILIVLVALAAPILAPFNPRQPVNDPLSIPSTTTVLGTDSLGRDFLSRLVYGARNSLGLSISAASITILAGGLIGLLAATFPGFPDRIILWMLNSSLAIPGLLLAMVLVAGLGPGTSTVIIAVGIGGMPGFARISRTMFKQTLSMGFVDAVRALGGNWVWNSWFHILPNAGFRLIPLATVHVAWAFIGTTTLTFLGFAGDPSLPEWGSMLNAGRLHLVQMPHLAILPGVAMSFTILSIHNLGTWLARLSKPNSVH